MNKELEALGRYGYHCNHYVNGEKDYKIIETALKALKIIKSKGVAVGMLQLEEVGLKEYNDYIGDKKLYLTEEEFNFLKEVLRNE